MKDIKTMLEMRIEQVKSEVFTELDLDNKEKVAYLRGEKNMAEWTLEFMKRIGNKDG